MMNEDKWMGMMLHDEIFFNHCVSTSSATLQLLSDRRVNIKHRHPTVATSELLWTQHSVLR